jgi:transcriptional regulator GlxA family with amidase domain
MCHETSSNHDPADHFARDRGACDSGRNANVPEVLAMSSPERPAGLFRAHRVAVLAVPPIVPFDLSIPDLMFGQSELDGSPLYEVGVCAADPGVTETSGGYEIVVCHGLELLGTADTIVVTGTHSRESVDPRVVDALRRAAADGRRLVSICTGAFVLAAAGLLDGRRATTYWRRAEEFADRFPAVGLDPRVLFVDEGQVLTSAGLAAGIDLCLHIIRKDFGAAVANAAARRAVVSPVRHGGQAQFIATPLPDGDGLSLAGTRAWALERLERRLTLHDLARHATVSVRTLTRRFRAETGLTPLQWLLQQRLERARELLEATTLPVDEVARSSGLGTADSLRTHLLRRVGLTPTAYRASFTRRPPLPGRPDGTGERSAVRGARTERPPLRTRG